MINTSLTNFKFKQFQWKTKRFSGFSRSSLLLTNMYFCMSHSNFYLSTCHIDLVTRYLKWKLKKSGSIAFPKANNYPITKKPTEVWMGKGKGAIIDWTIPVKNGDIPFFFQGKKNTLIRKLLNDVLKKLPIWASIIESKHKFIQLTSKQIFFNWKKLKKNSSIYFKYPINF